MIRGCKSPSIESPPCDRIAKSNKLANHCYALMLLTGCGSPGHRVLEEVVEQVYSVNPNRET